MPAISMLVASALAVGQLPPAALPDQPAVLPATDQPAPSAPAGLWDAGVDGAYQRRFLESDHGFPNWMIGTISNPVLAKDPRALTQIYPLFISDWIPVAHPVSGGGNFQVYGMGMGAALTDRLSVTICKGGLAASHLGDHDLQGFGWFNLAVDFQYTFIRDVEHQFLMAAGLQYEAPTGEKQVFQGYGDGQVTVHMTAGKEFGDINHCLATIGYQLPCNTSANSTFFYTNVHLDRQLFGWLYPVAELNWYGYTNGGKRDLPTAGGELDNLINLGTPGVAGHNLVTMALGLQAKCSEHVQIGAGWEYPLSDSKDFLADRVTVRFILCY